jgi:2-C-methyl-D-erythritol 4-phosphate cytidylyltransferase/2-C-methyl-D-erythritol 2,4-cyclodiphosphate synthase
MSTWAIVVAAGRSERFGGPVPKLLVEHAGRPLIATTLHAVDSCAGVAGVVLVASEALEAGWRAAGAPGTKVRAVVRGGATRQESVAAGLAAVPADADVVLVHDGARAFATPALFAAVAVAAREAGCALPLLPVHDTVKRVRGGDVAGTVPRDELRLAQTPQGFRREVLTQAHEAAAREGIQATDDVALVERCLQDGLLPGVRVAGVPGEESNVKVTLGSDLPRATAAPRVGLGHDVHPLVPGRRFVLAGVDLQPGAAEAQRIGPAGHSDGDALVHAACDALLGAVGLGDIGQWFPDTSPENAGRPSLEFLAAITARLRQEGWRCASLSAVVKLERPKLSAHSQAIRAALATALGVPVDAVGLSAKRGEGMGPVGEGRSVECDCVAVVERT